MKNLKLMMLIVLSITLFSCNKNDEGSDDGEIIPRNVDFQATINGGTFTDYQSVLDSYFASSTEGTLTIAVTDTNTNIVRLFINDTNGLNTGSVNMIGDESGQGFITTAIVRDQANKVTYTSVSGSISILENVIDADDNDISYVTSSFEIILNSETSADPVTLNGVFEDVRFVNQL